MSDLESGGAGTTLREGMNGRELSVAAETSASAAAAQAAATVQARYAVAWKRPRDMDQVRVALLKECARPGFAHVARYHKPVGAGIVGPSIRFAEAAARHMGNLLPEIATIYDDERKRIVRVSVADLETNVTYAREIAVDKTVERSVIKPDMVVLSQRQNSLGKTTYLVTATEDQLLTKQMALESKTLRTLLLRLIPGDLLEEAMAKVVETLEAGVTANPDDAKKKIADAFAGIGVQPVDLKAYLGHDLAQCSPAEIVHLRSVYAAIKDGEGTWAEAVESKARGGSVEKGEAKTTEVLPKNKPLTAEEMKAVARAKSDAAKEPSKA